jgi:hypothetical protein
MTLENASDPGFPPCRATPIRTRQDFALMIGIKKKKGKNDRKDGDKPAKPPPKAVDDDLYDSGDMAAPERDRDDEQRDL